MTFLKGWDYRNGKQINYQKLLISGEFDYKAKSSFLWGMGADRTVVVVTIKIYEWAKIHRCQFFYVSIQAIL